MDEAKHECGIAAISIDSLNRHPAGGASYYLFKMLLQMQNRGQLAAGISTYYDKRREIMKKYVDLGTVNKAFRNQNKEGHIRLLNKFEGTKGIGHVRYATFGTDNLSLAQPFERTHGKINKWFSLAFNGNITNFTELRKSLKQDGYHFSKNSDTEIIQHLFSMELDKDRTNDISKIFSAVVRKLDGAFNIVFLLADGTLAAFRDPHGFRPLVYGSITGVTAIASEPVALTNIGINVFHNLKPGHLLVVKGKKVTHKKILNNRQVSHCMFEWVYFANVASKIDNVSVYKTRWRLGINLARKEKLKLNDDFVVVPVPDTSKPIADAYASALGIPSKEGLIRNRYVGRTFIESSDRKEKIRNKYTLNIPVLRGKKIILVDDSVVRGNTSKKLIDYVKEAQVKEVHLRIACPPIFAPCFYGIDMSTIGELIANQVRDKKDITKKPSEKETLKIIENIRKEIGAKTLCYNSIDDLVYSLKKPKNKLCLACLNTDYPTHHGKKLFKIAIKNMNKTKQERTYEFHLT